MLREPYNISAKHMSVRRAIIGALLLGYAVTACAPQLVEFPYTPPVRRDHGVTIPLPAWLTVELRTVDGTLDLFLTREVMAPPEGVRMARDIGVSKLREAGIFASVEPFEGPPPSGMQGVILRIVVDLLIGTPNFGMHSFNPHAYLTVIRLGPGGVAETIITDSHFETRGVVIDSPLAVHEAVMLAWRAGATAITSQMANRLPSLLAASPAGARLIAGAPPRQPSTPSRPPSTPSRPSEAAGRRVVATGSGFLLRHTNLIVTNFHVVKEATDLNLVFPSGDQYPGRVVARDLSNDLALVEARGLRPSEAGVPIDVETALRVGEPVHALGYPLGPRLSAQPSMVTGVVSATVGIGDNIAQFRMTAPINQGNSGGPVVNKQGQVMGIAVSVLVREGVEGVRFGIKASSAVSILRQAQATKALSTSGPDSPQVVPPEDIFQQISPYVVLIEAKQ